MENHNKINGMRKWEVSSLLDKDSKPLNMHNGYFGSYSHIKYKGKESVVYVDDRDAIVKVCVGWYDKIYYGLDYKSTWDGDYRWNHDLPLVVENEGKFNLAAAHDGELLMNEWVSNILPIWKFDKGVGDYLVGTDNNGVRINIMKSGTTRVAAICTPEYNKNMMNIVKNYSLEDIEHLWIDKDMPCAHIEGLEYKGAWKRKISKEEAKKLLISHHRFGGSFNSAEWCIYDGTVTLLFRDYADSDYD